MAGKIGSPVMPWSQYGSERTRAALGRAGHGRDRRSGARPARRCHRHHRWMARRNSQHPALRAHSWPGRCRHQHDELTSGRPSARGAARVCRVGARAVPLRGGAVTAMRSPPQSLQERRIPLNTPRARSCECKWPARHCGRRIGSTRSCQVIAAKRGSANAATGPSRGFR